MTGRRGSSRLRFCESACLRESNCLQLYPGQLSQLIMRSVCETREVTKLEDSDIEHWEELVTALALEPSEGNGRLIRSLSSIDRLIPLPLSVLIVNIVSPLSIALNLPCHLIETMSLA